MLHEGTITWQKFNGSPEEVAETYWEIVNNHNYADVKKLLPSEGIIQIDNRPLFEYLEEELIQSNVQVKYVPLSFAIVNQIDSMLTKTDLETSDYISKIIASITVQNQKETRDVYIAQAIASLDDLTKTINLVSNRLREWYGLHFPELGEFIEDPAQFFRLIRVIGNKETADWADLGVSDNKLNRLKEMGDSSLGAEINIEDLKPIQDLAKLGLELINTRKEIEEYIENTVFVIMPNVTRLIGPLVSARLLAQAGSLRNLSKMASSTVQLLGAETALFRHLKTGEKPPKHGYLFQSPLIHQAPFHQRGKIARIIAGKITIAARLDHFLGEEQPGLVEDLNKRLEYVSTHFEKAPIREKRPETKPRSDRDRPKKRKFDDKDRRKSDERSKRGFGGRERDSDRPKRKYDNKGKKDSFRSKDRESDSSNKFRDRESDQGSERKFRDRGSDEKFSDRDSNQRSERKFRDRDSDEKFGDRDTRQRSERKFRDRDSDEKFGDRDTRQRSERKFRDRGSDEKFSDRDSNQRSERKFRDRDSDEKFGDRDTRQRSERKFRDRDSDRKFSDRDSGQKSERKFKDRGSDKKFSDRDSGKRSERKFRDRDSSKKFSDRDSVQRSERKFRDRDSSDTKKGDSADKSPKRKRNRSYE